MFNSIFIYIYTYVCMLLSDRVVRNHSCGEMIAYAGEWHDEVPGLIGNQVGKVVIRNIRGYYQLDMD